LGDLLLEKKLISEQQLKEALAEQRNSGRKLGRVLIDIGAVSEADLHGTLATALNIPYVDLAHMALDAKIVGKLPETLARRHRALVLKEDARGYLVGRNRSVLVTLVPHAVAPVLDRRRNMVVRLDGRVSRNCLDLQVDVPNRHGPSLSDFPRKTERIRCRRVLNSDATSASSFFQPALSQDEAMN